MKHCNHFLKLQLPAGELSFENEPKGYQGSWNGIMKSMLDSFTHLCSEAELHFNTPVLECDIQEGVIRTEEKARTFDLIVGCDGVGSVVLSCAAKQNPALQISRTEIKRRAKSIWMKADA